MEDSLERGQSFLDGESVIEKPLKIKSWDSLSTQHFNPIQFIIEDLLPPGVTMLAGRPKQGKSWLVHAMLLSVAAGRKVFGLQVERCGVLYMARLCENQDYSK